MKNILSTEITQAAVEAGKSIIESGDINSALQKSGDGTWVEKEFKPPLKLDLNEFLKQNGFEVILRSDGKENPALHKRPGKDFIYIAEAGKKDAFAILTLNKHGEVTYGDFGHELIMNLIVPKLLSACEDVNKNKQQEPSITR